MPVNKVDKPKKPGASSEVIKAIGKDYGPGIVHEELRHSTLGRTPTGVFAFDLMTGGGFPQGKMSIVYGPEESGKTNICLLAIARTQRDNPECKCVFVDIEGSLDPDWAAALGVDVERLIVVYPDYAEQAIDIVEAFIYADDVAVIVVDSLAAMITDNESKSSAEKAAVGGSALSIGKLYRKATVSLSKVRREGHTPTLLCINQVRMKIGVMYGNPETMPGGNSVKFWSALTIRMYSKGVIKKDVNPALDTYRETKAVVKKNKVALTSKSCEYDLVVLPHGQFKPGDCFDYSFVENWLKSGGILSKFEKGQGWTLFGESYNVLTEVKDLYYTDKAFADRCKNAVVALAMDGELVE